MIVFDDPQILTLVEQPGLLSALKAGFLEPAITPPRSHYSLPGQQGEMLLVMPSFSREAVGTKLITVMPANAERGGTTVNGIYVLLDGHSGVPLATFSARSLTAVRTAGVCALATSLMSRPDASVLLVIGTGYLVPYLIDAYRAVRSLERVVIWGRDAGKAAALAQRFHGLQLTVEASTDLTRALHEAHLISSATLARDPLVRGDLLSLGTHVDLVGSFTPEMHEGDLQLFRVSRLVVDCLQAFEESGDLIEPLHAGIISRNVPDLTALLKDPVLGRQSDREITVFKTVGTGLADLAAARYVWQRHLRQAQ
jgi:alanine dehydrogenase